MAEVVRKKVRWATKRRKGKSRVWKTRWVKVAKRTGKGGAKAAGKSGPKT